MCYGTLLCNRTQTLREAGVVVFEIAFNGGKGLQKGVGVK